MAREYQVAFAIGAKLQSQFGSAFKNAQTSVVSLQSKIETLNRKQGDISAYQRQQQGVEMTRAKLETLQKQYANLKTEMEANGEASASLKNAMLQKQQQIERTTAALEGQEKKLAGMSGKLSEAGVDTGNLAEESKKLSAELNSVKAEQEAAAAASQHMGQSMGEAASSMEQMLAAAGLTVALKAAYDLMEQCADASIDFESGMAGVQRTVGGSQAFLSSLGEDFKEMSTVIPITTESLTGIATTAGQLGVAQKNVESFTTVMAQLDTTTDLTAESAATMLAQFSNITGVTQYDRLGSVVADLGDATATTASKVVEMSQGMAAAAHLAGMGATDIMGISAAVGSLGVEAQAGSTAMSTLINTLYKAVETGDGLNDFASVANMSAEQFKQAWGENAAGALNSFIQGLNDTERNGKSAIVILDELGINNVRQTKAILGLASAGNLLSNTISQANAAWEKNTALSEKASVMYGTTSAKLTMAQNAANNLKIAIGDALTPTIGAGAAGFTAFVQPIAVFIQKHPALIKAFVSAGAVIGTVTVAITGYAAAAKLAAAASALFTSTIPGLNIILFATAAIAGLTAGVVLLADAFKSSQESMEELDSEFDDLNADFRKQSHIRSLCAEYKQLQQELYATAGATTELTNLDNETVTVLVTAQMAEGFTKLGPEDFVDGTVITLTGKEDTAALLDAVQFINGGEDGAWVKLNASIGDQLLSSKQFISDLVNNEAVIELSGKALETVQASGFLIDSDGDGKGQVSLKALAEKIPSFAFVSDAKDGEVLIQLTPGVATTLNQYALLEGSEVLLSAQAQAKMVEADDFMIGKTVELSASAVGKLYAEGFLNGTDIIYLNGAVDPNGKVTTEAFIRAEDRLVTLTVTAEVAEGFKKLDASYFVDGTVVTLSGEEDTEKLLEATKLLKDGENGAWIKLNAKQGDQLLHSTELLSDLVDGKAVVQLHGEALKEVTAQGFMLSDDNTIPLKALAEKIPSQDFISNAAENGEIYISLTPDVADTLDQYKLLNDSTVLLSAEAFGQMVDADEFMIGHEVEVKGKAVGALYAQQFLTGEDVINLSGGVNPQAAPLTADDFFSGEARIVLDAQRGETLLTAKDLFTGDAVIQLDGKAKETVTAYGFLVDANNTVPLKGEVSKWMLATDFFSDEDNGVVTVSLTPGVASKLNQENLLNGSTVLLNADAGKEKLSPDLLMAGKTVLLAAGVEASGTKEASEFLSGENIVLLKGDVAADGTITATQLVPESERQIYLSAEPEGDALTADSFFSGGKNIAIMGLPDAEHIMTAESFFSGEKEVDIQGNPTGTITVSDYIAAKDRTVELTANVSNLAEVQQAISSLQTEADTLKDKAATAKDDLTSAQTALADMETRQGELEDRLTHAGTPAAKSEIQAAIEAQSQAVEEQRAKVAELEAAYTSNATQYAITQAAADELAAKEQRLSAIKAELADASDAVSSSLSGESAAMDAQIEKAEQMAKGEQARLRAEIYENATKQAQQYADAVKRESEILAESDGWVDGFDRSLKYAGDSSDELSSALADLFAQYDALTKFDWEGKAWAPQFEYTQEIMDLEDEIFNLSSLMGKTLDPMEYTANGLDWRKYINIDGLKNLNVNETTFLANMQEINQKAGEYGEQLEEVNAIQQAFIENLASGVASGVISADEAFQILSVNLKGAGVTEEQLAEATKELADALGEGVDETEEMADGMDTLGLSAAEVNAAIQPILDQMAALGDAYQEAYDEAYKSMDGQFKLFEEAPQLTEESVDKMIASLQSQAAYMQEYSANLKAAGEMGLSEGLLEQLSDGSKESAAYLAAIVKDGATKIDELNTAFASVEEGKDTFADTVASMQTDFSAQMDQLTLELAQTVAEMDMSADAAQAGADTVQAFADAASGKTDAVTAAFRSISKAAKRALGVDLNLEGYASGTTSAERGFKLVGENGPEIMWFNGGEKVMNAQQTAAYQREHAVSAEPVSALPVSGGGAGPHIEVKPVYNLSGGMDTDEIRGLLDEHTGAIRDMVIDTIEELEIDRERSAYVP